jgi:hypothetical protein
MQQRHAPTHEEIAAGRTCSSMAAAVFLLALPMQRQESGFGRILRAAAAAAAGCAGGRAAAAGADDDAASFWLDCCTAALTLTEGRRAGWELSGGRSGMSMMSKKALGAVGHRLWLLLLLRLLLWLLLLLLSSLR